MPLQIIRQDITKMKVDAIVNTTNEKMIGYSGVDEAVHTIAGPEMDAECATLVPLGLGQAKITGGYGLPCKYVIHTSGPVWQGGLVGESAILRSCYIESLKLALQSGCRTVAFPLISSGAYGYPKDQVLKFAIQTITEFLFHNELTVYLCVFDKESYTFSQKLFDDIQDFIEEDNGENQNSVDHSVLPNNFAKSFKGILKHAEMAPYGIHALRHTFASMLFSKGVDVKIVSKLLGHSSVKITYDTYVHLFEKDLEGVTEVLD